MQDVREHVLGLVEKVVPIPVYEIVRMIVLQIVKLLVQDYAGVIALLTVKVAAIVPIIDRE